MAAAKAMLADHVSWRKIDETAVLLNLESSEYYTFNETGSWLLELLADAEGPEKMAEALSAEFDVSPEAALADVKRFLSRLRENGLTRS